MRTFIIWLTMVFFVSVYPIRNTVISGDFADKIFHAAIYAITCLLFYSTLKGRTGRWALPFSVLLATGYGFMMELAQHYTGYRSYSNYDVLANFTGAAAAALYVWASRAYKYRSGGE